MGFYPYLFAYVTYRTGRTARAATGTDMLPKWDEKAVDVDPVLLWQDVFKGSHGAFRRACVYVPPAVGDAMHMNVYANVGLIARNTEDKMGTFRADPVERLQQLRVARKDTAMVCDNTAGNVANLWRFHVVKSAISNCLMDRLWAELVHRSRRAGTGKQPVRTL